MRERDAARFEKALREIDRECPAYPNDPRAKAGNIARAALRAETDASVEANECWHVIDDERLMELLRRAHAGEDPDLLYIEEYANADQLKVEGDSE